MDSICLPKDVNVSQDLKIGDISEIFLAAYAYSTLPQRLRFCNMSTQWATKVEVGSVNEISTIFFKINRKLHTKISNAVEKKVKKLRIRF